MLNSLLQGNSRAHNSAWDLEIACGLGLLLGIGFFAFSPLWTLATVMGVGLVWGVLKRPELLPLAFLLLTSTVVRSSQAPSFSIGFGTLYLTDLVFLFSFGYITARFLRKADFKIVRTPLDWPLLIFWGAAVISTLIAISGSSLHWKDSLYEIRVASGYLMFFAVTNLVRNERQLILLIRGFILLATIVAVTMIVQYLLGSSRVILPGRIEDVAVEGREVMAGVTRIIPPGQSIIMVALTAVFAISVLERASVLRFLQCGLLALALVLTFFRASWLAVGATILIIGFLARRQEKKRFIVSGLVATALGSIVLTAVLYQPESRVANLAHAAFARAFTLFESRTFKHPDSSLRWRDFEYSYALPQILSHPLMGLGLGARYRPLTLRDHQRFDGRTFIHNGHIYVLLKSGVCGYLGLLWFMLGVLVRGLRYWRRISDPYLRGIVLAFALTSMGVLIVSVVEPYLMTEAWTPVVGIIAGINETILRHRSKELTVRQMS